MFCKKYKWYEIKCCGCGSDNVQATTLLHWKLCLCVLAASAFTWRCMVNAAPLLKVCLKFQLESCLCSHAVWWFAIKTTPSVLSYTDSPLDVCQYFCHVWVCFLLFIVFNSTLPVRCLRWKDAVVEEKCFLSKENVWLIAFICILYFFIIVIFRIISEPGKKINK